MIEARPSVTREPEIGEILLFCIDDSGLHRKQRPFLVVSIVDGDSVSGEVFADPLLDSKSKWALRLFNMLSTATRTQWVAGILPGKGVGQWEFREAPPVLALPLEESKPASSAQKSTKPPRPIPLSQVRPR